MFAPQTTDHSRIRAKYQFFDFTLKITRYCLILVLFGCIAYNLMNTYNKAIEGKTSVSLSVKQDWEGTYPSITFCPGMRNGKNLVDVLKEKKAENFTKISEFDFDQIIQGEIFNKTEFLSMFSHGVNGGYNGVLEDDSHWILANSSSLPDYRLSGSCYTYHPNFKSYPGKWFGIRFGIRFKDQPPAENLWLWQQMNIFIHDKNNFVYFAEEAMPSSAALEHSKISLNKETQITLSWSSFTSLSKPELTQMCIEDPEYNWGDCILRDKAKQNGCQPPWNKRDWIPEPVCDDINETIAIFEKNEEMNFPYFNKLSRTTVTDCPLPCTVGNYQLKYSTIEKADWHPHMFDGDWVVLLWFPSYVFSYQNEYEVCDTTCILGEVGGNLGFFLGGSILGLIDIVVTGVLLKYHRHEEKKTKPMF